jgi:DNA ligase (NAD+)
VTSQEPKDDHDRFDAPPEAVVREVERLRAEIDRHNHLYYVEARPEISDAEFDRMFGGSFSSRRGGRRSLTPDSPTQRVGVEPQDGFETVRHVEPMLSLDSTQERGRRAALRRADPQGAR